MAIIDYDKKEVNAKIVYYGPGLSGKTSNIHYIYSKLVPEHRGELMTLSTKSHRTLFFDFLPVELGEVKGLNTRFYLYTVPGQVFYNNIRKQVLKDVDGIVFVADSQTKAKNDNIQSYQNLIENLAEEGRSLKDIPHVLQYNKRDMPDIQSLEDLHRQLNKFNAPFFDCTAINGHNVLKSLTTISKMVLKNLREEGALQAKTGHEGPTEAYGLSDEFIAMQVDEANRLRAQMEQQAPARQPGAPARPSPVPPPPRPTSPVPPPPRTGAPIPPPPRPTAPIPPPPKASPIPPPPPRTGAPIPPPPRPAAPVPPPPRMSAPIPPPPEADPFEPEPEPLAPEPDFLDPEPEPETLAPEPDLLDLSPEPPPVDLDALGSEPEAPLAEPEAMLAEPEAMLAEPEAMLAEPEAPLAEPEAPSAEPEAPLAEPEAMMAEPAGPGKLVLQRWGEPQPGPDGALAIPVVFLDPESGVEFSSTVTISIADLEPAK